MSSATIVGTARTWSEMIKLSHSVFALPFALLATFLAARPQRPTIEQVLWIVACMVSARSAAMTFNRLVDAAIDARNPRTAGRPIPAGHISPQVAWLIFAVACAVFALCCAGFYVRFANPWPLLLSLPTLVAICGYSYAKRFTRFSHMILGVVIAFAPVAAWIAIQPATLGLPALLLMGAVACWIAGFDIIYACLDVEFDRSAGLHSLPSRIGVGPALWVARGLHVVTVALLVALAPLAGLGTPYLVGVAVVAAVLAIENAIVSPGDLSRVNLAFFTCNGLVGLVLGGMGICDILMR
ncbi:MAG: UbiA-like polyprenyltransferase [Phycisphaerae bacterium]|nr:UbiA-like polyprenyltransferase [Phycisphaerae bacterium]